MRPYDKMLWPVAVAFVFVGGSVCTADVQSAPLAEVVPTAVGTIWGYRWYDASDETWSDGVDVIRIVKEEVVNSRRKWHTELDIEPFRASVLLLREIAEKTGFAPPRGRAEPERYLNYYDARREAYIILPVDAQGKPVSDPIVRFPYPVKSGQKLQLREGTKSKVVDLKRKVKVEAGEFECIVLETNEAEEKTEEAWRHVDYFALGVGLIRSDLHDLRSGEQKFVGKLELIQFQHPKGK